MTPAMKMFHTRLRAITTLITLWLWAMVFYILALLTLARPIIIVGMLYTTACFAYAYYVIWKIPPILRASQMIIEEWERIKQQEVVSHYMNTPVGQPPNPIQDNDLHD